MRLDNEDNLLELIYEDYCPEFHEWNSDGSLELLDNNHNVFIKLSPEEVDSYVNKLIQDQNYDNEELTFQDAHILEENFDD